jgi:hypothetical protein
MIPTANIAIHNCVPVPVSTFISYISYTLTSLVMTPVRAKALSKTQLCPYYRENLSKLFYIIPVIVQILPIIENLYGRAIPQSISV